MAPTLEDSHIDKIAAAVAYKLKAPIEAMAEASVGAVVESMRKTPISITFEDLLAVAPKILQETKDMVSKKRVPTETRSRVHFQDEVDEIQTIMEEDNLAVELPDLQIKEHYIQADAISTKELPFFTQFFVTSKARGSVPKGAIVANDPVLQYLKTLAPGEAPKQIFVTLEDQLVGKDSAALRVVHPLINARAQEESILDGGSQIVSMAQSTAIELGVSWNPDINIFMQSANGQVEKTVGLAKDVAFNFGELTIYLQVHVINEPAYKVLLGRPFEILTASTVQNSTDGSQIVTLTDPHTKKRCALPTFARGSVRNIKNARGTSTELPDEPNPAEVKFHGNSMN